MKDLSIFVMIPNIFLIKAQGEYNIFIHLMNHINTLEIGVGYFCVVYVKFLHNNISSPM